MSIDRADMDTLNDAGVDDVGRLVAPGLAAVLDALGPDAHPVGIARFLLGPTEDLESELIDAPVSPRDWLIAGLPVRAVVDLLVRP